MARPASTPTAAALGSLQLGLPDDASSVRDRSRARIEAEHRRLGELLRSLTHSHDLTRIRTLLDELDELLVAHFAGEEGDDGLHQVVGEAAAHRLPNLQQLYDEHRAILARLDELRAQNARVLELEVRRIYEGVAELAETLRRHEAKEDELFGEAFYLDLGGRA